MNEVLKCDKCEWEVPVGWQKENSICWSCCDGIQRPSSITLDKHNEKTTLARREMIRRNIAQRGI